MSATTNELLSEGKLDEAVESARRDVGLNQSDPAYRFRLFQLLILVEDFAAAEQELMQIQALGTIDMNTTFQLLIAARERHTLLTTGVGRGGVVGWKSEQPSYFESFLRAIVAINDSKPEDAATYLQKGWAEVPERTGSIDGEKFSMIRDADDFVGPFVECLGDGEYSWITFENLHRIVFQEPNVYLDGIWIPTYLETDNGPASFVIPALYSGTGGKTDELRLGKRTEWHEAGNDLMRVYGQREFMYVLVGASEPSYKGIRYVREIVFD